jgi:hypothetical protein
MFLWPTDRSSLTRMSEKSRWITEGKGEGRDEKNGKGEEKSFVDW